MTKAEHLKSIDNIIQRHRQDLAGLLSAWRIKAPLTPETLINAAIVYKQPFVDDLYSIHAQTSSFHGDEFNYDGEAPEKSKFEQWLEDAIVALKVVSTVASPKPAEPEPEKDEDPRIFGISRTLFITAIVAFIIMFVLLVLNKRNG